MDDKITLINAENVNQLLHFHFSGWILRQICDLFMLKYILNKFPNFTNLHIVDSNKQRMQVCNLHI